MAEEIRNHPLSSAPVLAFGGAILDDDALRELLQKLALLADHAIHGAQAVSVTVVEDGQYRTINSTGPEALAMDEAQYRENNGPCLIAIRAGDQLKVRIDELEGQACEFVEEAKRANVGEVISTPLVAGLGEAMGALNVYVNEGAMVGDDDTRTAQLIADNAAILVGYAFALTNSNQLNDQLREAVASRDIIGAAKGILVHSQACTRDQAFDILRRASQRENRKLRDLAEELVLRAEARASRGTEA